MRVRNSAYKIKLSYELIVVSATLIVGDLSPYLQASILRPTASIEGDEDPRSNTLSN